MADVCLCVLDNSQAPFLPCQMLGFAVFFTINQHCFCLSFASDYGIVGSFVHVHGVNGPFQVISKEKSQDYEQKVMICNSSQTASKQWYFQVVVSVVRIQ